MLGVLTAVLVGATLSDPDVTPTTPPAADDSVRASFLGGSLVGGLGASDPERSFPVQTAKLMGWRADVEGQVETGYVSDGQGFPGAQPLAQPFWQRVDEVVAADPDVVVVQGGRADVEQHSLRDSKKGVRRTLTELRTELPDAELVVVGPFMPDGSTSQELEALRDAIRAEATRIGAAFVDPLGEGWITPDNADRFYDATGRTLNDEGHRYLAERLADELAALRASAA